MDIKPFTPGVNDRFVWADEPEIMPQQNEQPGLLKQAGQAAAGIATKAIQAPFKVAELPGDVVSWLSEMTGQPGLKTGFDLLNPIPTEKKPSEYIQQGAES